jgi:hypothetical protein
MIDTFITIVSITKQPIFGALLGLINHFSSNNKLSLVVQVFKLAGYFSPTLPSPTATFRAK